MASRLQSPEQEPTLGTDPETRRWRWWDVSCISCISDTGDVWQQILGIFYGKLVAWSYVATCVTPVNPDCKPIIGPFIFQTSVANEWDNAWPRTHPAGTPDCTRARISWTDNCPGLWSCRGRLHPLPRPLPRPLAPPPEQWLCIPRQWSLPAPGSTPSFSSLVTGVSAMSPHGSPECPSVWGLRVTGRAGRGQCVVPDSGDRDQRGRLRQTGVWPTIRRLALMAEDRNCEAEIVVAFLDEANLKIKFHDRIIMWGFKPAFSRILIGTNGEHVS